MNKTLMMLACVMLPTVASAWPVTGQWRVDTVVTSDSCGFGATSKAYRIKVNDSYPHYVCTLNPNVKCNATRASYDTPIALSETPPATWSTLSPWDTTYGNGWATREVIAVQRDPQPNGTYVTYIAKWFCHLPEVTCTCGALYVGSARHL